MRTVLIAFVLVAIVGCTRKPADGPQVPPVFDERQGCTAADDCVVVQIECCDACNGGMAVGVHQDVANEVREEYVPKGSCEGTACTLMACPDPEPICKEGRCGVKIGENESLPELPPQR